MPRITDERREARREQVLEAARACLQEHGLEAVSMEMIIVRSGLSTGAVYGYFKGKDDIINVVVTDGTAAMGPAARPHPDRPRAAAASPVRRAAAARHRGFRPRQAGRHRPAARVPARLEPLPERPRPQGGHPHRLPQTARAVRRDGPAVAGGRGARPRRRPRRGSGAAAVDGPGVAAARRAGSRLACRGLRVAPQPTSGDPGNLVRAGLSAKGGGSSPPLEAYTIS